MNVSNFIYSSVYATIFSLMVGCSISDINEQSALINEASTISGTVLSKADTDGKIYVKLYTRNPDSSIELVNGMPVGRNGSFKFSVIPNNYFVAAFVDVNDDQKYNQGEPAAQFSDEAGQPIALTVEKNDQLEGLEISIQNESLIFDELSVNDSVKKLFKNIGATVSIDSDMFARENANVGLWRPLDFINEVGGGLLLLQEYDANKKPVIFIHGIGGTPLEFKDIIGSLDTSKYQPWVLFYPSGVRLGMVSDYLLRSMSQLHDQYQYDDVIIIAHSMGGLMSRSYLMKHQEANAAYTISKYVTINSPLYGMDSAIVGVDYSPIVLPVWRDIASNSDYVKKIHQWSIPEDIEFHLVFSYLKGEDGDGVVPLVSQLSPSLQNEAVKIYGFNFQHAGILREPEFIEKLKGILK